MKQVLLIVLVLLPTLIIVDGVRDWRQEQKRLAQECQRYEKQYAVSGRLNIPEDCWDYLAQSEQANP